MFSRYLPLDLIHDIGEEPDLVNGSYLFLHLVVTANKHIIAVGHVLQIEINSLR